MSKAIFLVDDSPVIKGAFEKMNSKKDEIDALMNGLNEARKECWKTVETELISLGKIENGDIHMRYKDGCIFIVDEEEDCGCDPFKIALKKMFAED
jgi:hypothetical protein